jgi:hypothetical protein
MEQQLQIIALSLWAWVVIAACCSIWNIANMADADADANRKAAKALLAVAWSMQAILGLMLIQTLGLTV